MRHGSVGSGGPYSARRRDGVGESQLDECLPGDADSFGLAVDRAEQIDGKVDIHTLDFAAGTGGLCKIEVCAEVFASVVHLVETGSSLRFSPRGTALLRLRALGGPR